MHTKVFRIDNNPENLQRVDLFSDWCKFLCEHEEEALETLEEENLIEESISMLIDKEFSYFLCKRKLEEGKDLLPSNQEKAINRIHKKLWTQIEKQVIDLPEKFDEDKILYSFKRA